LDDWNSGGTGIPVVSVDQNCVESDGGPGLYIIRQIVTHKQDPVCWNS
jgi:putative heme iron utilization protein